MNWKKFILPIIFLLLFVFVTFEYYAYGSIAGKHTCESVSLAQQLQTARTQNNSVLINQITNQMDTLYTQSLTESRQGGQEITLVTNPVFYIIKNIDPLTPISCEFFIYEGMQVPSSQLSGIYGSYISHVLNREDNYYSNKYYSNLCETYQGDQSINCTAQLSKTEPLTIITPFTKPSLVILILNILILFAEGYLLSSIIFYIYNRVRKKSLVKTESNPKQEIQSNPDSTSF